MIGSIISGLGGIIGAIGGATAEKKRQDKEAEIADMNFQLQKDQFNYQKELNQIFMDREDNAAQRRAKDLQAAGLSKNLAAGSAASAQTMTSGSAPQRQQSYIGNISNAISAGFQSASMVQQINQTQAQTDLTKSQIQTEAVERANTRADTTLKVAQNLNTQADTILKDRQSSDIEKTQAHRIKNMNANTLYNEAQTLHTQALAGKEWDTLQAYRDLGIPERMTEKKGLFQPLFNDVATTTKSLQSGLNSLYNVLGGSVKQVSDYFKKSVGNGGYNTKRGSKSNGNIYNKR